MQQQPDTPQAASLHAASMLNRFCELADLACKRDALFSVIRQNDNRKWSAIRELYKTVDIEHFEPYPIDWMLLFSPIEERAWGEIRSYMIPMWPQYPIGKYFADFADPKKKIVIECDGTKFHDREKDRARDADMAADGWTVYRISGADCCRIINFWEEVSDDGGSCDHPEYAGLLRDFLNTTIEGLVAAIACVHYERRSAYETFNEQARYALEHRLFRGA